MNNNTMSIYAQALISNREYKKARVDGNAVGVDNARKWNALVKACLNPAYVIRKYRWDNMGVQGDVATCDQSALYNAIRPIIDLIGEVNGDKLNTKNVAEEFIANSIRFRAIDTSNEMAHARLKLSNARKAKDEEETEETIAHFDACKAEVDRLEAEPGNCKRIAYIQSETAFVKAIELVLGDAITKQTLRPIEDIIAEKEALKKARAEKRKANKNAKKDASK